MKRFWDRCLAVGLGLFILVSPLWASEPQVVELLWSQTGAQLAVLYSLPEGSFRLELQNHNEPQWTRYWQTSTCRLVGWTPSGDLVVDLGHGELEVLGANGESQKIVIPEHGFPVACDGERAYYLDQDRATLKAVGQGQPQTLCSLPSGARASGLLSQNGSSLALRRSLRTKQGWATEILVYGPQGLKSFGHVPGGFVTLSWAPDGQSLLANYPASEGWVAVELSLNSRETRARSLSSPLQWDSRGRLYAADRLGVYQLGGADKAYLATWVGPPSVWAVSPDGEGVVFTPGSGRPTMMPLYGRSK